MDKQQWLDRYRSGDVITSALDWDDITVRAYPSAAIAVGCITQHASYRGTPADGVFRVTQIAVDTDSRLRLAGLHYSPIAPPAPPADEHG